MYVIFLQYTHFVKKTLTVLCTLICEAGDRVKVDQSSLSADLHAVMLRHHCSGFVRDTDLFAPNNRPTAFALVGPLHYYNYGFKYKV